MITTFQKVNRKNSFMEAAEIISADATDLRRQIGVVIVNKENKIAAYGTNQATIKWKWFINWHKTHCLRKIFRTPKNRMYWFCPGCAINKNHAEYRAIQKLKEFAYTDEEFDLYLYGHQYCCQNCLEAISEFNIKTIYICNE